MRSSDWSSDVCSSYLLVERADQAENLVGQGCAHVVRPIMIESCARECRDAARLASECGGNRAASCRIRHFMSSLWRVADGIIRARAAWHGQRRTDDIARPGGEFLSAERGPCGTHQPATTDRSGASGRPNSADPHMARPCSPNDVGGGSEPRG